MNQKELSAIYHELNFWRGFVQTKRFIEGWVANIPTPELQSKVHLFIKEHLPKAGKVMDVGSGVVSILNGSVPKKNLLAVDPLGELYQLVFDYKKNGIEPPLAIPCEHLRYKNEFDIVHMSNALDHTQNPEIAFEKLLAAVKPGGHLIIQGFENEADFENWQGFHQNNLYVNGNHIHVESKIEDLRLTGAFDVISCDVVKFENDKNWFIWTARKR